MKLFILIATVAVTGITAASTHVDAMGKKVPGIVKDSFSHRFPGVNASWENEDGKFEANFEKDGKEMSATFSASGNLIEMEVEITISEIPGKALAYIKQHYKSEIKEASRITDAKGVVTYEAEVGKKDLIFDAQGDFLSEYSN